MDEFKVVEASSTDIEIVLERVGSTTPNDFKAVDFKVVFKVYYKFICKANSKYWYDVKAVFADMRIDVGKAMCNNLYGDQDKVVEGYLSGKIERHSIYGSGSLNWKRGWLNVGDRFSLSLNVYSPDNANWSKSVKFTYEVTKILKDEGWRRWYKAKVISVEGVELPKPEFQSDDCYLLADDTKVYKDGTLRVAKGTSVTAYFNVVNNGGDGLIAVQLWDTKNDEEVGWKEKTLKSGDSWTDHFNFVAEKDMDLMFVSYYWDYSNHKWVQVDTVGCGEKKGYNVWRVNIDYDVLR